MKKQFLLMMLFAGMVSGLSAQTADTLVQIRQKIKLPFSRVVIYNNVELNILPAEHGNEIMILSTKNVHTDSAMESFGFLNRGMVLKGNVLTINSREEFLRYTLYLSGNDFQVEAKAKSKVSVAAGAVPHIASVRVEDHASVVLNNVGEDNAQNQVVDVCRDTIRSHALQLVLKDAADVQLKGAAFFDRLEIDQEDSSHFAMEDIAFTEPVGDGELKRYLGCSLQIGHLDMNMSDYSRADVSLPLSVTLHRLNMDDASVYRLNMNRYHADSLFVVMDDAAMIVQGKDSMPTLTSLQAKMNRDTTRQNEWESLAAGQIIFANTFISKSNWSDFLSYQDGSLMFNLKNDTLENGNDAVVTSSSSRKETVVMSSRTEAGNDSELSEFSNALDTLGTVLKEAIGSLKEKRRNGHYWYGDWALYWGFMGSRYDMNVLPSALHFPNTPYDVHISFSSLSLEYQKKYCFNSRNSIGLGLAISWDNYRYNTPDSLPDFMNAQGLSSKDFRKGKFVARYVTVPISYTFGEKKAFNVGLEVLPGYLFKANEKLVWENHGEKQVQKNRNYSDVMPFKLDARLTLGWKWGSIYFQPSLLPVFKSGDDWDVVPMRVGLRFF